MMMNQQQQQHQQLMNMNPNLMSLNQMNPQQLQQSQPQMLPINRSYGVWPPHLLPQLPFQNPNPNSNVGSVNPPASTFKNPLGPRSRWKGKRMNNPNDKRRKEQHKSLMVGDSGGGLTGGVKIVGGGGANLNFSNYNLPSLNELQYQNRLKTRKFFPKKKFNQNNNMNMNMGYTNNDYGNSRCAPFAPRNTTSFLIRAKKSGGITSLVSPCPVTPAVLPTPIFSPSREVLVDMAKEEWGVDGYGSMKGLIRLRSPGHEMEAHEDGEDGDGGSSESDVEEHVEVERRLDHDLSRFEMIYNPNSVSVGGMEYHNVLENRVDDQDSHIAQLEEENMILKERLFLMEREIGGLTRRLRCLERRGGNRVEDHKEVVENESDDGSDSREYAHSMEENNDEFCEENVHGCGFSQGNDDSHKNAVFYENVDNGDRLFGADKNDNIADPECKVEKNNDELVDKNKDKKIIVPCDEIEQSNENMNKCADMEVKAGDN
ncbi:uncharacterized protein [Primulina eburnea]|uniref:uncharacterized protein n=1 Tax=Primulina eburnea TaxID=1245227 RepID=UPI003C6C92F7